jgi:predicted Zn-dependent protease
VSAPPGKKLVMLEKLTRDGSADPFHWYALAIEYKNHGRLDEALQTFTTLRARAPDYVPMYLICAQMLERMGQKDEARTWCETGIVAARAKGDSHAVSEIEGALAALR